MLEVRKHRRQRIKLLLWRVFWREKCKGEIGMPEGQACGGRVDILNMLLDLNIYTSAVRSERKCDLRTMCLDIRPFHSTAAKRHPRCPTNKRTRLPYQRLKVPVPAAMLNSVKPPFLTPLQPQLQVQVVLCPGSAILIVRVFVL